MQRDYQAINKFVDDIGKKKIKKGWKVVRYDPEASNQFYSAFGYYRPTRYRLGEWAKPNKGWGPLCLFDTQRNAVKFFRSLLAQVYVIMPCEYEPSKHTRIWRKMLNGIPVRPLGKMAKGTVFADRVRLLKK